MPGIGDATGGIDPTDTSADAWEDLDPATYTVEGGKNGRMSLNIVLLSISQDGGLRIAKRERPYRPGVKLDDTDRRERVYNLEVLFHNDVTEETAGMQMWPDRANAFGDMLEVSGFVGTLDLPWKRNIKCRCEKYTRKAGSDQYRGGEVFSVTFVEDNEENLSDAVKNVSVKAGMFGALDGLQAAADAQGIWDGTIGDIVEKVAALQALIEAPGDYLETILSAAKSLERTCIGCKNALTTQLGGSNQGNDPAGSSLFDSLTELQDMAGRVGGEVASRFPATRTVRYKKARSIYDIATELGQSASALIAVNSDLEDPSYIEAGTSVQVFV